MKYSVTKTRELAEKVSGEPKVAMLCLAEQVLRLRHANRVLRHEIDLLRKEKQLLRHQRVI